MRRHLPVVVALASAAALAGCGGGADVTDPPPTPAMPAASALPAVPATPVAVGETVRPGPRTPAPVARALTRRRVVVIGFVLSRPQDDRAAAHALTRLRRHGPGASGVDHFLYRVDRSPSFGDLPELLDVAGTPTVAVIGRDGRLRNRFTSWTDAGALRQAVAEAKRSGAEVTGARQASDGPAGDPAGIALARRVNARYAAVPGVRMTGTAIDDRIGPADVALEARLSRGRISGWSGRFSAGGVELQMATASGALRARVAGASCWAGIPASESLVGIREPMIPLSGNRMGTPRRHGGEQRLTVTGERAGGAVRATYRIDRRTARVVAVEDASVSVSVTDLPTAPVATGADPLCTDAREAFTGLPGAASP